MTLAERVAEFAGGLEVDVLPADRVAVIERAALSLDSLDSVATLLTACRV